MGLPKLADRRTQQDEQTPNGTCPLTQCQAVLHSYLGKEREWVKGKEKGKDTGFESGKG